LPSFVCRFTFGVAKNRSVNESLSSMRPWSTVPNSIASVDSSGSFRPHMKCAGLTSMRLSCDDDTALRSA
jgi:hypothetical protein